MAVVETRGAAVGADEQVRIAGTLGLVTFGGLAVVLGVHPPGDSSLYDDGVAFVEHVSAYWMTIHVIGAALFLLVPHVLSTYGGRATTAWGRAFGRVLATVATFGTALAILHLVAIDTISFAFFADTLASGAEGAEVGADLLLRLHAASLTAWIVAFFLGVPAVAAAMSWADGDRSWRLWLPAAAAALAISSLVVTIGARQYTTLSEMILFRAGATLLLVWMIVASWQMRRDGA